MGGGGWEMEKSTLETNSICELNCAYFALDWADRLYIERSLGYFLAGKVHLILE